MPAVMRVKRRHLYTETSTLKNFGIDSVKDKPATDAEIGEFYWNAKIKNGLDVPALEPYVDIARKAGLIAAADNVEIESVQNEPAPQSTD